MLQLQDISARWPVAIDSLFGCALWKGDIGSNGRPIIWRGRAPSSAHKVVYEELVGEVPLERVLDHLCRRPLCVNPLHLEPVTKVVNEQRKSWAVRCLRTHCARGHDLSTAMITPERGRLCRHCHREQVGVGQATPGGGCPPSTIPR